MMSNSHRIFSAASGLLLAVLLTACGGAARPEAGPPPEDGSEWAARSESGSGDGQVVIESPSAEAVYFFAMFWCAEGTVYLEMVEDSRVYMGGDCGGPSEYQMPLPAGSDSYTFTIETQPGNDWTFSGYFGVAGATGD